MTPSPPELRNLSEASKEYLEAIYELEEEGRRIVQARIGSRLGLSPATVSEGVRRLAAEGHVTVAGRDIVLTPSGRALAETLVRRHRLAERMLTDILGIPWHLCHHQAEDWEKVMTDEVEQAIRARIGEPATCPHGNPIPGTEPPVEMSRLTPVSELPEGASGTLQRLLEDVELNAEVMRFLQDSGLMPGARLRLVQVAPDGTRMLDVDGRKVALGAALADNLWVLADPAARPI